jgi:threonine-phosphate decarboxylase
VPELWAASDALHAGLVGLGLTVSRTALPFMLVRTGDGAATRAALLGRGSVVRDCASFGLPTWVRVAPRQPADNARLLEAWKDLR